MVNVPSYGYWDKCGVRAADYEGGGVARNRAAAEETFKTWSKKSLWCWFMIVKKQIDFAQLANQPISVTPPSIYHRLRQSWVELQSSCPMKVLAV